MKKVRCPSHSELADFSIGKILNHKTLEDIDVHLSRCPDCLEAVQRLSGVDDELITALRRDRGHAVTELSRSDRRLLNQVLSISPDRGSHDSATFITAGSQTQTHVEINVVPTEEEAHRLGQYRLLDILGEGGMGVVYRAMHVKLKRFVALKVLRSDRISSREFVARFEREIEATGQLNHPNIVAAFDAGESKGEHFLVMELLDGVDLSALAFQAGKLRMADACEVARQVAIALQHAHSLGLVHRDVKPSNIMLCWNNAAGSIQNSVIVKLLDLGLSRLEADDLRIAELTDVDQVMGSIDYMSPEQRSDSRSVGPRSDIYSLGATLFRLLVGPYTSPDFVERRSASDLPPHRKIPSLSVAAPDLPPELADIVDKMVCLDPTKRFASADEVAAGLTAFVEHHDLEGLLFDMKRPRSENKNSETEAAAETLIQSVISPKPESDGAGHRTKIAMLLSIPLAIVLFTVIWFDSGNGYLRVPSGLAEDAAVELKRDGQSGGASQVHGTARVRDIPGQSSSVGLTAASSDAVSDKRTEHPLSAARVDQIAARWVIEVGGRVVIEVPDNADGTDDGRRMQIDMVDDLPDGAFVLRGILLNSLPYVTDSSLAHLQGLAGLEDLTINNSRVTGEGLQFLNGSESLLELRMSGIPLEPDALDLLTQFPKLRNLQLHQSQITDQSFSRLPSLQNLERISLRDCCISDASISVLNQLPALTKLILAFTSVTDAGLAQLKRREQLTYLHLHGCPGITDTSMALLESSEHLANLLISGTRVTDDGLKHLQGIKNLKMLQVSGDLITAESLTEFERSVPDCRVFVRDIDSDEPATSFIKHNTIDTGR